MISVAADRQEREEAGGRERRGEVGHMMKCEPGLWRRGEGRGAYTTPFILIHSRPEWRENLQLSISDSLNIDSVTRSRSWLSSSTPFSLSDHLQSRALSTRRSFSQIHSLFLSPVSVLVQVNISSHTANYSSLLTGLPASPSDSFFTQQLV